MKDQHRNHIMARASRYWTDEEHADQLEEECAELIVAMKHLKRKRGTNLDVLKEIADVEIMLDYFKKVLGTPIEFEMCKNAKLIKMDAIMDRGGK